MEISITLLGKSQTFVGVLSTLLILCITRNENNFILDVLKKIKSQVVSYIKGLKPDSFFEEFSSSEFKLLKQFLGNTSNQTSHKSLYQECVNQIIIYQSLASSYQQRFTQWDMKADSFAKRIENKEEQLMAPLSIFAYSIIVFAYDELLRSSYIPYKFFFLQSLAIFSILVFVFWTIRWIVFFSSDKENKTPNKVVRFFTGLRIGVQLLCHILLTFLLYVIWLLFIKGNFLYDIDSILLQLVWFLPFLLIGFIHISNRKSDNNIVCMHYVNHLMYFFVFSFFITVILRSGLNLDLDKFCKDELFGFFLKLIIILNILLYGLVFPFIMPLISYYMMYVIARLRIYWIKIQVWNDRRKYQKQLKDLAKKIPS